jgi:alpha-glucosidase
MRALLLEYPDDPKAIEQNNEFLFGDDLLVSPVVKDGEWQWPVYVPRGHWYDYWTDRRTQGPGTVTVDAPLGRIPIFVRGGAIIPTQQVVQYVDQEPINPLTFEIYPDGTTTREYYEDDGLTFDYQRGEFFRQQLTASQQRDAVSIDMTAREGSYAPPARSLVFKIHAERTRPLGVTLNAKPLEFQASIEGLEKSPEGWAYDQQAAIVWIKTPDRGQELAVRVSEPPGAF